MRKVELLPCVRPVAEDVECLEYCALKTLEIDGCVWLHAFSAVHKRDSAIKRWDRMANMFAQRIARM